MKKKIIILFVVLIVLALGVSLFVLYKQNSDKKRQLDKEKLIKEITNNYSEYVIVTKDANLLDKDHKKVGSVSKDTILNIEKTKTTEDTKYFKIVGLDTDYYISYKNVAKSEKKEKDNRYLKYVPFDKNIKTKDKTNFYFDEKIVYTINKSFDLPIYIIDSDKYYIEYDNKLMYVLKSDVDKEYDNKNSDALKATKISTIAYHFIYNPEQGDQCDQEICQTTAQVQSHIDYLKQNGYLSLTMKEFEMWIDGKLNLPKKSIMITIDDGWYWQNAIKIFDKNEFNATMFVVSSWYNPSAMESKYLEFHSHTYDMHNQYACPGYGNQGGGLLCLDKATLVADLKKSREMTYNTTALAYPFYDVNDHAIEALKEAGFTMGFAGLKADGNYNMTVGANKFKIPRITFSSETDVEYLKTILATN